jgi:hypothetical protein
MSIGWGPRPIEKTKNKEIMNELTPEQNALIDEFAKDHDGDRTAALGEILDQFVALLDGELVREYRWQGPDGLETATFTGTDIRDIMNAVSERWFGGAPIQDWDVSGYGDSYTLYGFDGEALGTIRVNSVIRH